MQECPIYFFNATLQKIGINPFVFIPNEILQSIFSDAGKNKGFIPVRGTVNGKDFNQTLVRYAGEWRLYINSLMLKKSSTRIGEILSISLGFDSLYKKPLQHLGFREALKRNAKAQSVFDTLAPSRRHEIERYIAKLKTEKAIEGNIAKAILFLEGKARFVGRSKP